VVSGVVSGCKNDSRGIDHHAYRPLSAPFANCPSSRPRCEWTRSSEVSGAPGAPRKGEWKIRVPVARFDEFQAAVVTLGELQKTTIASQGRHRLSTDLPCPNRRVTMELASNRRAAVV